MNDTGPFKGLDFEVVFIDLLDREVPDHPLPGSDDSVHSGLAFPL